MSLFYKSPKNKNIDINEWKLFLKSEQSFSQEIDYGEYKIYVNMRYAGTKNNVFKVFVDCSSDIEKYCGYTKGFYGKINALKDYNRIVAAIQNNEIIFEEILESSGGIYKLYYDVNTDKYFLEDQTQYPFVIKKYNTRAEAEAAFNELSGG